MEEVSALTKLPRDIRTEFFDIFWTMTTFLGHNLVASVVE